ncbi:MAG: gluconate 2-dehydrogenase subunit 3 family protein [Deltaproteobacteria bacterium]|nr:gluconate 2-dehydrogenase subunit 3 family protein [Deltaproteobacteria bacterium]
MSLTRRQLFRVVGGAAILAKLPACGDNADPVFSHTERTLLRGFADVVIPKDDTPGGADLGAVAYIERLITAFSALHDTPAIYAGGPFSGRVAYPDGTYPTRDFERFIELDRVSLAAWQTEIASLDQRLRAGLKTAAETTTKGIDDLTATDFAALFDSSDDDFKQLMLDLVFEAAWAAPEYGGNPGGAGWQLIHFEGDSLPLGYSQWNGSEHVERPEAPLSTANPSDPEPLTDDVRQLLATVIGVLGGRVS